MHNIFLPSQAIDIMSIPLATEAHADYVIWEPEIDGVFLVRTAYRLIRRAHFFHEGSPQATTSGHHDGRWERLCEATAAPRIKNFLWRAYHESLATRVNLHKRGLDVDVYCPLCGEDYEIVTHLMTYCNWQNYYGECLHFALKFRRERQGIWYVVSLIIREDG